MTVKRALITVVKRPEAGATKTRLCPPLSPQQAADFYYCLMRDTLALMARVPDVKPIVAFTPLEAEDYFLNLTSDSFELIPQRGRNLGERLDNVLTTYLQRGYSQVVVMDSDSPTLPITCLGQAFGELDDPTVDVVLGPCEDGGYYLIGLKAPCSALFRGIVMSTPTVTVETLERAREQGLKAVCLPRWYDVDTPENLERLIEELRSRPDHPAKHTKAFLQNTEIAHAQSGGRRLKKRRA
jgi:rSAM/selenodomain-associated transferase 1